MGERGLSDLPALPSVLHTASSASSSDIRQPLTILNADDFFIMKASSECKYVQCNLTISTSTSSNSLLGRKK